MHRQFIWHTFHYVSHSLIITISLQFIQYINPSDTKYSIRINNQLILFHVAPIYALRDGSKLQMTCNVEMAWHFLDMTWRVPSKCHHIWQVETLFLGFSACEVVGHKLSFPFDFYWSAVNKTKTFIFQNLVRLFCHLKKGKTKALLPEGTLYNSGKYCPCAKNETSKKKTGNRPTWLRLRTAISPG